jgi:predicted N-acetyltransferase YhbS
MSHAPVAVREMTAEDIPAGLRLCRASRWNQTARDWAQFLELAPHGARVAVRDGGVIGTVATLPYEDRFGWIGMVLVDPAERGHGVGTRLLEEGLALLSGTCARLDATPAGRPLYAKLGFREEYGLARMQRPPVVAAPSATPTPAVRSMTALDLAAVAAFDREVFDADRSAMLRWLLEGAPEYARVLEDVGGVAGYSFGRHGHDFEHVGPLVANHDAQAAEIAAACLGAAPRDRPLVIDAARHSSGWLAWLVAQRFTEQRPFFRMYKGENAHPGLPQRQFAILGPEFG